jgi:hypothetical protein
MPATVPTYTKSWDSSAFYGRPGWVVTKSHGETFEHAATFEHVAIFLLEEDADLFVKARPAWLRMEDFTFVNSDSGDGHRRISMVSKYTGKEAAWLWISAWDGLRWMVHGVYRDQWFPGSGSLIREYALNWASEIGGTLESDTSLSQDAAKFWWRVARRPDVKAVVMHGPGDLVRTAYQVIVR